MTKKEGILLGTPSYSDYHQFIFQFVVTCGCFLTNLTPKT